HLPGLTPTTEKSILAVGLESRDVHAFGHLDRFENVPGARIDASDLALVAFPRAVPQLAVDPGHAGDMAIGLDGAKDLPGLGIDLMDLPIPMLTDPERSFRPREPGIRAAAGCGNGCEHPSRLRVDLLDPVLGDLKEVLAVERRSRVCDHVERALQRS